MTEIKFPYGKELINCNIDDKRLKGVLLSRMHEYVPDAEEDALVLKAMENPINSPRLSKLAEGKKNIVIIASDHTRPVPSKHIIPHMLNEIKSTNADADITILIATGCHRSTTKAELIDKLGEDIVKNVKIVVHDCLDEKNLVKIGTLPSGGDCVINKLAYDCDLLLAEGFIELTFSPAFPAEEKACFRV